MDSRLVAWARAVKARRGGRTPVLWLFTDAARMPDPLPAIAALPCGLCGVVFRHDGVAGRAALAAQVARLCRARRLALTIAGDWRLAARLGVGVHWRAGRQAERSTHLSGKLCTASAHDGQQIMAGVQAGAVVFLSPVFPTASHPGASGIGPVCWAAMARRVPGGVWALGGMDGASVRRLPRRFVAGAGAISALAAPAAHDRQAANPR